MATDEREITEAARLCTPDGRLDRGSVGWSRRPLHDCALPGPWGRRKRWDYWCVVAEPLVIQLTVLNADFLRLGTAAVFESTGGDVLEATVVRGPGPLLQDDRVGGAMRFEHGGLRISAEPRGESTVLSASFAGRRRVDLEIEVAPADDSLSVVVPWSDERYQYTSKHVGRRCEGWLQLDGAERAVRGWAALDYGRGRWPSRTRWNWGAAAGEQRGRWLGLQLGAQWTDGTGMTENGVFFDGVLDKLGDRLIFEPGETWRIRSPESDAVDLRFAPERARPMWIPGLARLDLQFGRYTGVVRAHGERIRLDGLFGWAEEMRVRW